MFIPFCLLNKNVFHYLKNCRKKGTKTNLKLYLKHTLSKKKDQHFYKSLAWIKMLWIHFLQNTPTTALSLVSWELRTQYIPNLSIKL